MNFDIGYRLVIIANNRATVGRMVALHDVLCRRHEVDVILGCSAWDSPEFLTPYRIQSMMAGDDNENMVLTTANYTLQLCQILRTIEPQYAIIHGDRYEQLGAAMACAYMNIPIVHTEGGDHTSSIDEKVRWAISSLSSIHFPATEESALRLLDSLSTSEVFNVGSTGVDLVRKWEEVYVQKRPKYPYVLVLHHPDTETRESITPLIRAVLNACGGYRIKWVNANVDAGSRAMMKEVHTYEVDFIKNLDPTDYFALMKDASLLIGNSSSFIKEAAFLGKRAVVVGSRQGTRELGKNVIRVDNLQLHIEDAIAEGLKLGDCDRDFRFGDGHASEKILRYFDSLGKENKEIIY